jgi:hypothetical protein
MNKEFGMADEVSLTIGTALAMAWRGMKEDHRNCNKDWFYLAKI